MRTSILKRRLTDAHSTFKASLLVLFVGIFLNPLTHAQDQIPVDYWTQVQPIFDDTCGGGFCHIGLETSGTDLSDYDLTMMSMGEQYEAPIVVPGNPDLSPLWEKIAEGIPTFGDQMPWGDPPLSAEQQDIIYRWIEEGANEFRQVYIRGDVNVDEQVDLSDVVALLGYLYLGHAPPVCLPTADIDSSTEYDITDPIYLLSYLYLGGPAPQALSREEQLACNTPNQVPDVDPIGTLIATAGIPLNFEVMARDPDDDDLIFTLEIVPEGLEIHASTGEVQWTPDFHQLGDHRIRIAVADVRAPERRVVTTGLIRVEQGNLPPQITDPGTQFIRENLVFSYTVDASDPDGDDLTFAITDADERITIDPNSGLIQFSPNNGDAGEYIINFTVTDSGTPPFQSEGTLILNVIPEDSPTNLSPVFPTRGIYRTYTGLAINIPLNASDPDGHDLTYQAENLPEGAELDAENGVLTWTPSPEQTGPFYIPVEVTDNGLPPITAEEILVFQVNPPDACVTTDCDPETGCTSEVFNLEQQCCEDEPTVRPAEPVADCPSGQVLYAGRNSIGFGRLYNCDFIRVRTGAQGGVTVRLNFEARCIDTSENVSIRARLETSEYVLFDDIRNLSLKNRNDGFAQILGVIFAVDEEIPLDHFFGVAGLLTIELTDSQGVELSRKLRLTITRDFLRNLPDPDISDVRSDEVGCVGCHRPLSELGERHGIEDAHPWFPLSCTDCHGGNPNAFTRAEAHVSSGESPQFIKNLAQDQLDQVDPDYLRFVNPGDLRVATVGCGSSNPANPGLGCHQSIVDTTNLSVMTTYAGHYTLPRYLTGSQPRADEFQPLLAAVDRVNPHFDPETAPPGAVGSFEALRGPHPEANRATLEACMDIYLPKSCPTCHTDAFGDNNAPGNYRSSGCTSCHMTYTESGLSESLDPVINKDFPPHPKTHQLTSAIPTEQCGRCHFQGGRIGLAYRGIREGGFPEAKTPTHAVPLGREIHNHEADYYFTDEDSRNNYDETPPDLHFSAGMVCADCHVGGDVHGDGNMYSSERHQVGIRCEDCHGTVRKAIEADVADGLFKTSKGFDLKRLRKTEDGTVFMKLLTSDVELEVPQIFNQLQSGQNQAMIEAMGVNESGFSHTDSMECYTCHTSWRLTCFGCHVTVDDRLQQKNKTTGEITKGGISAERLDYSIDFFALGMNERGKISPLCSSMSMFMSYVDEAGQKLIDKQVRTSSDGKVGNGWNPFHHHTVSRVPQNCDRCHPNDDSVGEDNSALLNETYGFGNGNFMHADGNGVFRDLSAFLDEDGNLIGDFPHPNTGPVLQSLRDKAMSIKTIPHPRQERD